MLTTVPDNKSRSNAISNEVLPPGTLLQFLHLKDRLRKTKPGKFVEVGSGRGLVSKILLNHGWTGMAFDLNKSALEQSAERNEKAVTEGRLQLCHGDWLSEKHSGGEFDLVISCFVLEHLDEEQQRNYVQKCKEVLSPGGQSVLFVPSSPKHWGIEDDIAGHFRRYTRESLRQCFDENDWCCKVIQGLNYPVSNLLLPLSNKLVRDAENERLELSMIDRTKLSSTRTVSFKTTFPSIMHIVLNDFTIYPFHVLQKMFANHTDALVIYAEFEKRT